MTSTPTVHDVAVRANVSASTVSRAFSRPELVSEKTRNRVLQVASELNFSVSRSSLALKSGQSFRIALLLNTPVTTWFGANIFEGLDLVFHPAGYDISIYPINSVESRTSFFDVLPARRNADAVIVPSFNVDSREVARLKTMNVPIAGINTVSNEGMSVWAAIDDAHGLRLIVRHLVSLGHRRIVYVCRDPKSLLTFSAAQRIRGFREACQQAHIQDTMLVIPEGDDSLQSTFNALIDMQPMPTAICCQEDGIAIPLMCRLREFGLKIPSDISITGFDDGTYSHELGLTTIRQQPRLMGREVAEKLLDLINHKEVQEPHKTYPVELIVRSSTAPPRE